jgi:Ni/Fe-hydrogenase subunit HybB-like protein
MSSRERAVGAMPPPQQQQPEYKLLSPRMKWLYRIGFVACLCVVAIAGVGVFAIADAQERKFRISNTRFADWVYSLVQFNQVDACSSC